jgi:hypothetical protein
MDNSIPPSPPFRPDVVAAETAPRPTAPTPRASFSEVLSTGARTLARGAQATVQSLPMSPLMAVAVRPGSTTAVPSTLPLAGGATAAPEGPSPSTTGAAGGTGSEANGSLDQTLAQDQQLNLYYLQIQEQVNAQNRTFTALSNVLEVEHSTAKAAIGNIH